MAQRLTPVILAAGKGSRMRSKLDKVMHPLGGRPLLGHVLDAAAASGGTETVVVLAPAMDAASRFAQSVSDGIRIAIQSEPLGTGHAVQAALGALPTDGTVVVLFGDTPFLSAATIRALATARENAGAAVAVLGMELDDATGYGRLVIEDGDLVDIVEEAQATAEQRTIRFANSGVMAFDAAVLATLLERLPPRQARDGNAEYYLTDCIAAARAMGRRCTVALADPTEGLGINDRRQLAEAEAILQARLRERAMLAGATLIDPETVYLSADTELAPDVVVEPHVYFGPGVVVEEDARIRAFSHLGIDPPKETKKVIVRKGAVVGPFARLRSGADIGVDARIGNFVEVKNTEVGDGAKANHLTYLGDASIGAKSNIGAGTITCNYDGYGKHRTEIGTDVFIGSNSTLIAPIKIGDGAFVAAGSWAGKDVPPAASHVARGEAKVRENGATQLRALLKRRAGKD